MTKIERLAAGILGVAACFALVNTPAQAQAAAKPEAHETNIEGVTAEVIDAVRKEGVLTLKLRFRNSGAKAAYARIIGSSADRTYVVAGSTKLMMLKDSKGYPLMTPQDAGGSVNPQLQPGGSYLFWAKYPAPPAEAKKITFFSELLPPIEDIPIKDVK